MAVATISPVISDPDFSNIPLGVNLSISSVKTDTLPDAIDLNKSPFEASVILCCQGL